MRRILMKLLLYTDLHLATNGSIVTGKMTGQEYDRFSARNDICIRTMKFINDLAKRHSVDEIVCLGDLVDQPKLSAEELSAISESKIYDHKILIGNHDVSSADGYFNSCNLYGNAIRTPMVEKLPGDVSIVYLPWSKDIIDLYELCKGLDPNKTIILSHNDLKGIYYGNFLSTYGYDIKDILNVCRYFINGHLHVGKWVQKDRILNLGTISGLNFNNIGGWIGYAVILDTDTMKLTWFENPYALHFYDQRIVSRIQLNEFFDKGFDRKKFNVVQLRVPKSLVELSRNLIDSEDSIKFSRILTLHEKVATDEESPEIVADADTFRSEISVFDSLRKFVSENCPSKYDKDSVLKEVDNLEAGV